MMTFSFAGGKFTRYFTSVLPAVLITTAIGVQAAGRWITQKLQSLSASGAMTTYARLALALLVVLSSLKVSANSAPHFRLYTNAPGGGMARAGYYFPHDEFYDASMRDVVSEIARGAKLNARVVSESPSLAAYYAQRANRPDLVCVSLSDLTSLQDVREGDFVIIARGRRYFSNDAIVSALRQSSAPTLRVSLGTIPSADVYLLDDKSLAVVRGAIEHSTTH
jgi:hypothetical protein